MANSQGPSVRPVSSFYGEGAHPHPQRDSIYTGAGGSIRASYYEINSPNPYTGTATPHRPPYTHQRDGPRDSAYSQLDGRAEYLQNGSPGRIGTAPDLYADFNGVGAPIDWSKRMSSADMYGGPGSPGGQSSPNNVETGTRSSLLLGTGEKSGSKRQSMAGGELLLAPELGKDWEDQEARLTKIKREKSTIKGPGLFELLEKRIRQSFEWKRFVFIVFGFLCCLAALLYFIIPRSLDFQISAENPLTSNEKNATFTRVPAAMHWQGQLNIAIDGRSNWISFHFSKLEASVFDLRTGKQVAEGGLSNGTSTFPGRKLTPATIGLSFSYRGNNDSDLTWLDFYNACGHKYTTVKRPNLDLKVVLEMSIRGLLGTKAVSTTLGDVECPIELASNQV